MNGKKIISIGLATILSTSIYFSVYANTLKEGFSSEVTAVSSQTNTVKLLNNELANLEHGFDIKRLISLYDEEIELTDDELQILEDLELLTGDLFEMFYEFGCIDEDGTILSFDFLTTEQVEEIKSYVKEIKILQNKLVNGTMDNIISDMQKSSRENIIEISEQFGLIQQGQFDFDSYMQLTEEEKEEFRQIIKENKSL